MAWDRRIRGMQPGYRRYGFNLNCCSRCDIALQFKRRAENQWWPELRSPPKQIPMTQDDANIITILLDKNLLLNGLTQISPSKFIKVRRSC